MPLPVIAGATALQFLRNNFKAIALSVIFAVLIGATLYYRLMLSVERDKTHNLQLAVDGLDQDNKLLRAKIDEQNSAVLLAQEKELERQAGVAAAMLEAQKIADRQMGRARAIMDVQEKGDPCSAADELVNKWIESK